MLGVRSLCAAVVLCAIAVSAAAESRVALVIANHSYAHAAPLAAPAIDRPAVVARLTDIGFDVVWLEDAGQDAMSRAVADFAQRAQSADLALVYYTGHARQFRRRTYLLPVDADIGRPSDIHAFALPLDDLLRQLEAAGAGRSLVILDAWRADDETEGRLVAEAQQQGRQPAPTSGYSPIDRVPDGVVLWLSTEPDTLAAEGQDGGQGPFAAALLAALAPPGRPSAAVFDDLAARVRDATGGAQVPQAVGRFDPDMVLVPPPAADPGNRAPQIATPAGIVFRPILLGLAPPRDPDGDPLTVTVVAVPDRGRVAPVGGPPLSPGQTVAPDDLARLAYLPDLSDLQAGDAGVLELAIADGRGGESRLAVPIAVGEAAPPATPIVPGPAEAPAFDAYHYERRVYEPFLRVAEIFAGLLEAASRAQIVVVAAPPGPPAIEGRLDLSDDDRRLAERTLAALGLDPGPVDGTLDDAFRDALADYQRQAGLPPTGELAAPDWAHIQRDFADLEAAALVRTDELPAHVLQTALAELDHYTGPIDGLIGRGSRTAMRAFQRSLGHAETGDLTPGERVALIRAAADAGDTDSRNIMGILYGEGIGVVRDDAQAVAWFRQAVDQGDGFAAFNLALHYRDGRGIAADAAEAGRLLQLAHERGHADAPDRPEDMGSEYIARAVEPETPEPPEPPPPVAAAGTNTCRWANDGFCDDSSYVGNDTAACPHGTDANDCRGETPRSFAQMAGNDCQWAFNFECDEPGLGSGLCPVGTDANDCNSAPRTLPVPTGPGSQPGRAGNSCQWAFDGECDDSRYFGFISSACPHGTDEADCAGLQLRPGYLLTGNTCQWAFDGDCDDYRYVGGTGACPAGTDASDCQGYRLRR